MCKTLLNEQNVLHFFKYAHTNHDKNYKQKRKQQHKHGEKSKQILTCLVEVLFAELLKADRVLRTNGQVVEHALHLGCELRTALEFQLADHQSLHIIRGRALVQQTAG